MQFYPRVPLSHSDSEGWLSDISPEEMLSGAQGRHLMEQELSKQMYQEEDSLLGRFIAALLKLIEDASNSPSVPNANWIGIAILVVLIAAVFTLFFSGRGFSTRYGGKTRKVADSVVFEDDRSAVQYLAAVRNALNRGDYTTAFLEQFRHMLKLSESKGGLVITPGLTALEASQSLTRLVPRFGSELDWAAHAFNGLRFGHRESKLEEVKKLQALDDSLDSSYSDARSRPATLDASNPVTLRSDSPATSSIATEASNLTLAGVIR